MQERGRPAPGYRAGRLSFRADVWPAPVTGYIAEPGRDGQSAHHADATQRRRVVPLATKLDIPTANGVGVAIGLSGGDSGRWRLGPHGRVGSRAEPRSAEAPRTPQGGALPSTSVTPNHPTALHRGGVYPIPSTSDETTEGPTASPR
jgi:hypothetical protein